MDIYNPSAIGVTTGFGVPAGGTANQVLIKNSGTNYDASWGEANPWNDAGTITVGAVSAPPTKGTTVQDKVKWRRLNANTFEIDYRLSMSATGGAGSGNYLFTLPDGLTWGAGVLPTTSATATVISNRIIPANGTYMDATRLRGLSVVPYNTTQFRLFVQDATGLTSSIGSTSLNFSDAGFSIAVRFQTS